jgi:hypothetical protein
MKWQEGWWFIQVLGTSEEELKPWVLYNENGNRAEIAAQTAGNEDEIRNENGRLLLEPDDNERSMIYQVLVGVEPSRMQLFPTFGRNENPIGLETAVEPGQDEQWVTGYDSPYNNPSSQSEVVYVNDMSPLRLEAFNPMDESDEARLSFHINKINYATVQDTDLMKAMLQNQIPSSKHMMGLGATERDQLQAPEWVMDVFGDNIMETSEILNEGDTSQVTGDITQVSDTMLQQGGT